MVLTLMIFFDRRFFMLTYIGSQCKQKAGVAFVLSLPFERLFWTNFQFSYILWKFVMFVESKRSYFIIRNKKEQVGSQDLD